MSASWSCRYFCSLLECVARESAVAVGTRSVQLVLIAPLSIQGQVIDGQGNPVPSYEITARPEGSSRWSFEDRYRERVDDPAGMFELSVPYEGGWSLTLESEEYLAEEESTLVTAPSSEPVTLVMNRAGKLAGIVVDPFGAPIADAEVRAQDGADAAEAWWGGRDGELRWWARHDDGSGLDILGERTRQRRGRGHRRRQEGLA